MTLSPTEVTTLRNELVHNSTEVLDVTKFSITVTSALIGFGFSAGAPANGYIMLVPLLVLATFLNLVTGRRLNVVRIATYLRAFAGHEHQWETRLWQLRQRRDIPQASFQLSVLQMYIVTGFVCIILSVALLANQGMALFVPVVVGVLWAVFCILQWRTSRRALMGGHLDEKLFQIWHEIASGDDAK